MIRLLLLILILLTFVGEWYLFAIGIFVWYLFRYTGYELVLVAVLLDGYYGAFAHIPILTISAFLAWSAVLVLRTRLLLYTQDNEIIS